MQPDTRDGGFPVSLGLMTQMLSRKGPRKRVGEWRWMVITSVPSVTIRGDPSIKPRLGTGCGTTQHFKNLSAESRGKKLQLLVPQSVELRDFSDRAACAAPFMLRSLLFASLHKSPVKFGLELF